MPQHETTDQYWERKRLEMIEEERQAEKDRALIEWSDEYDRRKAVRLHTELYERQNR